MSVSYTHLTFDPQIESIYASRYNEHYDLFMKKYGESEWGYKADENSTQPGDQVEADAALSALLDKVYEGVETNGPTNRTPLYKGMGADGMSYQLSYFLGSNDLPIEAGLASCLLYTSTSDSAISWISDSAIISFSKDVIPLSNSNWRIFSGVLQGKFCAFFLTYGVFPSELMMMD